MFDAAEGVEQFDNQTATVETSGSMVNIRMTNTPTRSMSAAMPTGSHPLAATLVCGVITLAPNQQQPPRDLYLTYTFSNLVEKIFVTMGLFGPVVFGKVRTDDPGCKITCCDKKFATQMGSKFGSMNLQFIGPQSHTLTHTHTHTPQSRHSPLIVAPM
jgi:hypothetical protein